MALKQSLTDLASLLPDNLSEDTLTKIVGLIQETIKSEVTERMKVLEAKASAFIRKNIDSIKNQALSELTEESDIYQDAMQFRKLKGIMGVDKIKVSEQANVSELQEENAVLLEHLNVLATENSKFKKLAKTYKAKAILAEQTLNESLEEVQELKESNEKPFKSSEKALVIVENNEVEQGRSVSNPFLGDEVLALMPKG